MRTLPRALVSMALAMVFGVSTSAEEGAEPFHWKQEVGKCPHGLHHQPNGPFAVVLYCEDALGSYLSVLFFDPMGAPGQDRWDLGDRYWHDPVWGSDVTSYAWSPDGKSLFVATSEVYGSGGLFELDLYQRKVRQVLPKGRVAPNEPRQGFTILSLDRERSVIVVSPGGDLRIEK